MVQPARQKPTHAPPEEEIHVESAVFRYLLPPAAGVVATNEAANGHVARKLAETADLVIVVCPSLGAAAAVRKQLADLDNVSVLVAACDALPLRGGTFDGIALPGMESATNLDAFGGLLSTEGWLYVSTQDPQRMVRAPRPPAGLRLATPVHHYPGLDMPDYLRITDESAADLLFAAKQWLRPVGRAGVFQHPGANCQDRSIMAGISRELGERTGRPYAWSGMLRLGSSGSMTAMFGNLVVRFPETRAAMVRCQNNWDVLEHLGTLDLDHSVPKPVGSGEMAGVVYYAESRLAGSSPDLTAVSPRRRPAVLADAMTFLHQMRRPHALAPQLALQEFDVFRKRLHVNPTAELAGLSRLILEKLGEEPTPAVVVHGDFKLSNFLIHRGRLTGIIDWDRGAVEGAPLIDALFLVFWENRNSVADVVHDMFELAVDGRIEDPLLADYVERFALDDTTVRMLALVGAARVVNRHFALKHLATREVRDRVWARGMVPAAAGLYRHLTG